VKKLFITALLLLTLFSVPLNGNSFAAEMEGVGGGTYLTFLNRTPYLDQFSFEEGGAFHMAILEKEIEGQGTYDDLGVLFTAEWTSTDQNTTYDFSGLSFVGLVIMGYGKRTVTSGDDEGSDSMQFFGLQSDLIPD
jgi:hypothetical protein